MGLADRDYTKRDSRDHTINSQQHTKAKNTGQYVDVEDFMRVNYAQAVRDRDANLFAKIKNKILRILRL
jgi:hypothetical protein